MAKYEKTKSGDKKCSCCGYIFNGGQMASLRHPPLKKCHCGYSYSHPAVEPFTWPPVEMEALFHGLDLFELLQLAEDVKPPNELTAEDDAAGRGFGDVEFPHPGGWKVIVFYDGLELDYIDSFIAPDGEMMTPWVASDRLDEYDTIKLWRGVGSIEDLKRQWGV
jgi:hypothetical protein